MSSILSAGKRLLAAGLCAGLPGTALAQAAFAPQGSQYAPVGSLPYDQVLAQVAIKANGGFAVWQDIATDGDGLGISARRLDSDFNGPFGAFRVNEIGAGDQENAQVALLSDGGAVFVWQGGSGGSSEIYARFMKADGTFATGDVHVNTFADETKQNPSVAVLKDGSVVVAWASFGQDGSQFGVYAQRLSGQGAKLGGEFRVNQTTANNQKSPVVAALANGNFIVAWLDEQPDTTVFGQDQAGGAGDVSPGASVAVANIMAAVYNASGQIIKPEFRLNSGALRCANPALVATEGGGFAAVWSGWNEAPGGLLVGGQTFTNGWDVFYRAFMADGSGKAPDQRVNSYTTGDQLAPRITGSGPEQLVIWSSLGQEGFQQGVYGQFIAAASGTKIGAEFRVNTTTAGPQLQPSAAADGAGRFLVVWSTLRAGVAGYDLAAQRYASSQPLLPPSAPFVSALSQTKVSVAWPEMAGYDVAQYELMVDDNAPLSLSANTKDIGQLLPGSSHTFRLAYVLTDGRRSPVSAASTGKTWGDDENFDGLPDDWQTQYWGSDRSKWPAASVDSDGDGATNLQEFLAGTDPTQAGSVLKSRIDGGAQGPLLTWNTQPGVIYQVQTTADFSAWANLGAPRLAAGTTDAVPATAAAEAKYYRIVRVR